MVPRLILDEASPCKRRRSLTDKTLKQPCENSKKELLRVCQISTFASRADKRLPSSRRTSYQKCAQRFPLFGQTSPILTLTYVLVPGRPPTGAASPDIGRATATMCFGVADAPLTAAKEKACREVRRFDGGRRHSGFHHHYVRKHGLGPVGPTCLARGPRGSGESRYRAGNRCGALWPPQSKPIAPQYHNGEQVRVKFLFHP